MDHSVFHDVPRSCEKLEYTIQSIDQTYSDGYCVVLVAEGRDDILLSGTRYLMLHAADGKLKPLKDFQVGSCVLVSDPEV